MKQYRCEICGKKAWEYVSTLTGLPFFLCDTHMREYEQEKGIELEEVIE